ncbi:capsid protein [Clostridium sp. UBA1353]|uniref:capsid protein n=1 Tax=Clostridium sp. UBA1353 TaxID=1946347 RepID=UPI003216CF43
MFDKLKNGVRKAMRSFLNIQEAPNYNFMIQEGMNYEANAFKNMIWYRGDSYELNQLYKQVANYNYSFWGSVPTVGLEIRKIHTGLPKIIVNQLVNIVLTDLNIIEFKEIAKNDLWKEIVKENKFNKLLERATREALVVGDGAFKISFDSTVSELPILEFYSGEKIDIVYDRGRVKEIVFQTNYTIDKVVYALHETYGFGYVTYKLFRGDSEVNLNSIPQTENLVDVTFDKSFCMAVPYMIYESDKWEGRGQSIFDSKCDNFDSLDETWSQWIDALRAGRAKTYIPDDLLPRNPNTGEILKPSYFDNRYIQTEKCMKENVASTIDTEQPTIPTENYLSTYVTALDLCLQGIISPSTLGIDNKKLDNAEAQREKEKTTLYTRNKIIEAISDMLPTLIDSIFKAHSTWIKQPVEDNVIEVSFGEYASPSFEAVVETLSNPNTPMSIEAKVEEMWGDSKTEEWKKEEVERIKEQTGIAVMDEPSVPGYDEVNIDNENSLDGEIDEQE